MSRRSLRVASADVRSASASASDDDSDGGEPEAGGAGQCAHVLRLRATRAVTARITDPEQWACEQDGCGAPVAHHSRAAQPLRSHCPFAGARVYRPHRIGLVLSYVWLCWLRCVGRSF